MRTMACRYSVRPAIASCSAGVSTAVCHIGWSSRGGPGRTTTVGLPATTMPGAVPTGSRIVCTCGHHRLLAVGGPHGVEVHVGEPCPQPLEDLGDLLLEGVIQHQFASAELRHHFDRHVVGRRSEPAAGDDQVDALVGQETQLRRDVGRPVAADRDVRQLDAEFE